MTLRVNATGNPTPTYQWRKNGVAIPGATSNTLQLGIVPFDDPSVYDVQIFNVAGTITSSVLRPTFRTGSSLSNLSVRTTLGSGETLIVGAVASGGAKSISVRAAGPALNKFGLVGMTDPRLDLFAAGGALLASNDDWPASLAPTFQLVGAFAFDGGSRDAALSQSVSGSFTVQVRGTSAGTVLVEAYDAAVGRGTVEFPRLVNVSARQRVGTGSDVLVAGLAVSGLGTKLVLIRAVGPGLVPLGVSGALHDPRLQVFNSSGAVIASNDDWTPGLAARFSQVSAFALPAGSKDAALVAELQSGSVYTVQVSGADGGTGEALIEVYEIL